MDFYDKPQNEVDEKTHKYFIVHPYLLLLLKVRSIKPSPKAVFQKKLFDSGQTPAGQKFVIYTLENDPYFDTETIVYYPNSTQIFAFDYSKSYSNVPASFFVENRYFKDGKRESCHITVNGVEKIFENYETYFSCYFTRLYDVVKDSPFFNQQIVFSNNRDTDKQSSSYYIINSNTKVVREGEDFHFKIQVRSHGMTKAFIGLCFYDSKTKSVIKRLCDTCEIVDKTFEMNTRDYQLGRNIIKGEMVSYHGPSDITDTRKRRYSRSFYFEYAFYVVDKNISEKDYNEVVKKAENEDLDALANHYLNSFLHAKDVPR